jgi:DNA invertase Pin-like site-specific DNA recombinase
VDFYEDAGISGSNGRDKRPGFDQLLNDATARKINTVAAWSVDRLGRSLQHLVGFLNELQALNCHLYLHQQAIDTTTPSGRAMFQMCGVFAEFERSMIVERVNAGLARAKANGVKLGRGNRKDRMRSADEKRWGMSRAELETRIRRLRKQDMGESRYLRGAARPGCSSSLIDSRRVTPPRSRRVRTDCDTPAAPAPRPEPSELAQGRRDRPSLFDARSLSSL